MQIFYFHETEEPQSNGGQMKAFSDILSYFFVCLFVCVFKETIKMWEKELSESTPQSGNAVMTLHSEDFIVNVGLSIQ